MYIDYVKFLSHCQKEFCSENLLFISIIVQWQYILIKHNLWPTNEDGELNTSMQLIDVNVTKNIDAMDISSMFVKLEKDYENDDNCNNDYSMFATIIDKIYKKYIEMNKAPFEINISFDIRQQITDDYVYIKQNKNNLNSETFWNLWEHLLLASAQVMEMIPVSLMRCFKHQIIPVKM